MKVDKHTLPPLKACTNNEFGYIARLLNSICAERVLAINPRGGEYLRVLMERSAVIDSFVSDAEWVCAAGLFSDNVYTGSSHNPLSPAADANYDLVIVCEDMGFVDDCDAMLREYYRLLKPGGILLGGIWNIRYADNIDRLLIGRGIDRNNELCGNSVIPLDCLTARLAELGFASAVVHGLQGERENVSEYADASERNASPVPPDVFNTKIYFICAYK